MQLNLVGGNTGHVQQVVDEPHELRDLAVDHLTSPCRRRRRAVNLQGLQREPYRRERVPELVRQRREEFVLALILRFELGRTVTNPELQLSIQCFRAVLRGLQAFDEIPVLKSQPERGFDRPVESPVVTTIATVNTAPRNPIIRWSPSPSAASAGR